MIKRAITAGACLSIMLPMISKIDTNHITSFFSIRSQGRNSPRQMVGWTSYTHQTASDEQSLHATWAFTPSYTRSFRHTHIEECLFGSNLQQKCKDDDQSVLVISGSRTTDRNSLDLLADYFYLPTDFSSTVSFKPHIDNIIAEFSFHIDLYAWAKGLCAWIYAPVTHTRWDIDMQESVTNSGILSHDPGYFASASIARNKLLDQFILFTNGASITTIPDTTFQALNRARISNKTRRTTRLADLRMGIGWDFVQEQDYHFGISAEAAAPVGTRPKAEFLFEPIVGNGHHWEFGAGVNGKYIFADNDIHASILIDAHISHLFKSRQQRTFDLKCNGPLSRYMLAEKMSTDVTNDLQGGDTPARAQFAQEFAPVANISTQTINVSASAQTDITLMLTVANENFGCDIGYNFWARSKEDISFRLKSDPFPSNTWAMKGDAHVFGFEKLTANAVALSATENRTTINTGTNFPATGTTDPDTIKNAQKNPNIDNKQPAFSDNTTLQFAPNNNIDNDQINTSIQPLFISQHDLDIESAQTSGLSHKIFTHLYHSWKIEEGYSYLGIGAEAEFAQNKQHHNNKRCGISQWGIWIKGGMSFT